MTSISNQNELVVSSSNTCLEPTGQKELAYPEFLKNGFTLQAGNVSVKKGIQTHKHK